MFLIPDGEEERKQDLGNYVTYKVIDLMGCAVCQTKATDSEIGFQMKPSTVVKVLKSIGFDTSKQDLVHHVSEKSGENVKGWASIQLPQGS